MRLHHPYMQHTLHYQEGHIPLLVVESPRFFREIIEDLTRQVSGEDGVCVLSHSYKPLDISKHLRVIDRYTSYDMKERRLVAKFQEYIRALCKEELVEEGACLEKSIQIYLSSLIQHCSYPLVYEEPSIDHLFIKALGIMPDIYHHDPLERLIDYLDLIHSLIPEQVFLLVRAYEYFEEDEIKVLLGHAQAQKWCLMLLEHHMPERVSDDIDLHVIDKDLCEL